MHDYVLRVQSAIADLKNGKMIILTDDPDRENEGDLIFPAEIMTAEKMNFMIQHTSGIICLSLPSQKLKQLGLHDMVPLHENTSSRGTPFTVSIEAKHNVTTGVSAADRATTVLAAMKIDATENDIAKPGHVFPLRAKAGGVLERRGHTEGGIDLVQLAGFRAGAVLSEIMNSDGSMARGKSLEQFAVQHDLKIVSIADIVLYRLSTENLIEEEVTATLPLKSFGDFTISVIKEKFSGQEHVLLSNFKQSTQAPLVRVHSSCLTGDLFGSQRCDCHDQLFYSLDAISKEGGMLVYLNQEGRGIGLLNKIKAYALQENGMDTVDANIHLGLPVDSREYYIVANILRNKNLPHIRLLTNNPEKITNLKKFGVEHVEREAMPIFESACNKNYLQTKKEKLLHWI